MYLINENQNKLTCIMIKKTIISSLLFLAGFTSYSQTVNDVPISEINEEYIQIVGTSRFMSNKVNVEIDFGQHSKFFSSGKQTQIKDENGSLMKFNSMIDALNFMNETGYEFVQAYAIAVDSQNVHHYLMRKRK
jgi:hypothetical protein